MSIYSSQVNELNNALLEIVTTKAAKYISLHSASPGTTGANEISGGSYARQPTTWGTISAGAVTGSQVTINVPAGTTVVYWGIWDAATGGNYYDGGQLPSSQTYTSAGTYLLTATLTAS